MHTEFFIPIRQYRCDFCDSPMDDHRLKVSIRGKTYDTCFECLNAGFAIITSERLEPGLKYPETYSLISLKSKNK